MKYPVGSWCGLAASLLAGWLASGPRALGEDVTTLSGQTYRQVRLVRVEPDGIVWEHVTGVCKVAFTDLPEALRQRYHYNAAQAAAYQAAQVQVRQRTIAQAPRDQRAVEARRVQLFQGRQAGTGSEERKPGEFSFRRDLGAASPRAVAEGIAAKNFRTKDDGTIWDRRLWAVPVFLWGGNPVNGVAFDPQTDLESHAFQGSLHHGPGGFAPDAAHDPFYQPDYLTRSYNRDMERAEAFARGRP